MISQTADYALRAIVCMANQPESARTTEQIATEAHVPPGYLSKVLQTLGRANLVRSRRGLGGGFSLVRPVSEVSVLDVINAVDPIRRIAECPLGNEGHGVRLCPLHRRLDAAIAVIEESFRSCTIAELLSEQEGSAPMCQPRTNVTNDDPGGIQDRDVHRKS